MKQKVNQFLTELFDIIKASGITIVPRQKNMDALDMLEMLMDEAIDEIFSLTYKEYSMGPEKDDNGRGDVWVFGKIISETLIYIKLKIDCINSRKIAKCLSFHPAEYKMNFPLKGEF